MSTEDNESFEQGVELNEYSSGVYHDGLGGEFVTFSISEDNSEITMLTAVENARGGKGTELQTFSREEFAKSVADGIYVEIPGEVVENPEVVVQEVMDRLVLGDVSIRKTFQGYDAITMQYAWQVVRNQLF